MTERKTLPRRLEVGDYTRPDPLEREIPATKLPRIGEVSGEVNLSATRPAEGAPRSVSAVWARGTLEVRGIVWSFGFTFYVKGRNVGAEFYAWNGNDRTYTFDRGELVGRHPMWNGTYPRDWYEVGRKHDDRLPVSYRAPIFDLLADIAREYVTTEHYAASVNLEATRRAWYAAQEYNRAADELAKLLERYEDARKS